VLVERLEGLLELTVRIRLRVLVFLEHFDVFELPVEIVVHIFALSNLEIIRCRDFFHLLATHLRVGSCVLG